jgi:hypothetical protein
MLSLGPAAALALAGCAALTSVRPRYTPKPGSLILLVAAEPAAVVRALDLAARESGLVLAASAPEEGYVETAWQELPAADSAAAGLPREQRLVRLRFFADPRAGQTLLAAECVIRRFEDPSLPERELERMVSEAHPCYRLLQRVVRDTQRRLGGMTPAEHDSLEAR